MIGRLYSYLIAAMFILSPAYAMKNGVAIRWRNPSSA